VPPTPYARPITQQAAANRFRTSSLLLLVGLEGMSVLLMAKVIGLERREREERVGLGV